MRNRIVLPLLFLLFPYTNCWSEEDEKARIQMINEEEKRAYENEMKASTQLKYKMEYGDGYKIKFSTDNQEMAKGNTKEVSEEGRRRSGKRKFEENWCYHCASPLSQLSNDMRKAMTQFLELRRTSYPKDVVTPECLTGRNISKFQKQQCRHKYCQTLVLTDHDEGASFVLRGCAENFGAINPKVLDGMEDNTCTRLHDHLDIKECICRNKNFCYSGSGKRRRGGSASTVSGLWFAVLISSIAFFLSQ